MPTGREARKDKGCYHDEGTAKANILPFSGCAGGIPERRENCVVESMPWIFASKSMTPAGVGGDADDAGEVVLE
jgi:hypothetical protein